MRSDTYRYRCMHYRPVRKILTNAGLQKPAEVCRSFRSYNVLAEQGHGKRPRTKDASVRFNHARAQFHKALKEVPAHQKEKALEIAKAKAPRMHFMAWAKTAGMGLVAMTAAYSLLEGTLAKPIQAILKTIGIHAGLVEVIGGGICLIGAAFIAYARISFKGHRKVRDFISALESQPNRHG